MTVPGSCYYTASGEVLKDCSCVLSPTGVCTLGRKFARTNKFDRAMFCKLCRKREFWPLIILFLKEEAVALIAC